MALPYPEGEVFFKRSVLKNNGNGLDPDNLTSFNSHALVEWCWNAGAQGVGFARNRICHIDGKKNSKEQYAYWEAMVVSFGTKEGFEHPVGRSNGDQRHDSRHSGIKRVIKTMLPDESEEYEKRAKGGPTLTTLTPIKLKSSEPYMYIDLNVPIRAIYFPLAQKPSTVFPDLCSYLMVDFRMRQGVKMYDSVDEYSETDPVVEQTERTEEEEEAYLMGAIPETPEESMGFKKNNKGHYVKDMKFDLYTGLGQLPNFMISLYIPGIYNYLILPRQIRSITRGLFMPTDPKKSLIRVHDRGAINSGSNYIEPVIIKHKLSLKLDMTKVLEGHLGVQVVWQPFDIPEPEDANQMFKDLVEAGLCFVPVVGPLASTCFTMVVDIIENLEEFKKQNPLELSGDLLENVSESAEAISDGFPKYSKVGKMAKFFGKVGKAMTKVGN